MNFNSAYKENEMLQNSFLSAYVKIKKSSKKNA